jgi:hypothetical protein
MALRLALAPTSKASCRFCIEAGGLRESELAVPVLDPVNQAKPSAGEHLPKA